MNPMEMLKSANLAVRFLLEICVLVALGYWGFQTGAMWLGKVGLGLGAPLLAAVVWGVLGAPQSTYQRQGWLLLVVEVIVFGAGPAALAASGHPRLAWTFVLLYVLNRLLMLIWSQ
jgi:hypothetical protein